jgi:hypothetical protein
MAPEELVEWFDASRLEIDRAADRFLNLVHTQNRTAFELAATHLLAVLARGQELPPVPGADAQRHFAAGNARYTDAAQTLARRDDEAEMTRAVRAIDAATAWLRRPTRPSHSRSPLGVSHPDETNRSNRRRFARDHVTQISNQSSERGDSSCVTGHRRLTPHPHEKQPRLSHRDLPDRISPL